MREFVLFTRGWTKPFHLNSLTNAGRMDLIARCITNSIFISEAIRPNVKIHIVLNGPPRPPITITFDTNRLKRVAPDERNVASHIKIALEKFKSEPLESEPGIFVQKKSFEELLKENLNKNIVYMHPNGEDIKNVKLTDFFAIIGDHKGIPKQTEKFIEKLGIRKVSVGKIVYLASQVITILHYEADRLVK